MADHKRQSSTIERTCQRQQARMDKLRQQQIADYALRRLIARFEQTGEC